MLPIIRCKSSMDDSTFFRLPSMGKADLMYTSETQPCCTSSNLPAAVLRNEMAQLSNNRYVSCISYPVAQHATIA